MAYFQLEPFGDQMADLRHGTACALLANVNRNEKTHPDPYRPDDFIYWSEKSRSEQDFELENVDDPVAHSHLLRAALFGVVPPTPDSDQTLSN